MSLGPIKAQPPLALAVAVLGMALTTWGALTHTAPLVAPGATLIFVGAAWLGNALARLDVRLFPARSSEPPAEAEEG